MIGRSPTPFPTAPAAAGRAPSGPPRREAKEPEAEVATMADGTSVRVTARRRVQLFCWLVVAWPSTRLIVTHNTEDLSLVRKNTLLVGGVFEYNKLALYRYGQNFEARTNKTWQSPTRLKLFSSAIHPWISWALIIAVSTSFIVSGAFPAATLVRER